MKGFMLTTVRMSLDGHWPVFQHKHLKAKDMLWSLVAKRAWWWALTLEFLGRWLILFAWKELLDWIATIRGMIIQWPGAATILVTADADVKTELSVKKRGACICSISASLVGRRRTNVSAWSGDDAGGDMAEMYICLQCWLCSIWM
jgi:hypothetical protein